MARIASASRRSPSPVESVMSANTTVTVLRTLRSAPSARASSAPQFQQNRACSGLASPQVLQVIMPGTSCHAPARLRRNGTVIWSPQRVALTGSQGTRQAIPTSTSSSTSSAIARWVFTSRAAYARLLGVEADYREDLVIWSGREDSNLRPPEPHSGALPDCATPRPIRAGQLRRAPRLVRVRRRTSVRHGSRGRQWWSAVRGSQVQLGE